MNRLGRGGSSSKSSGWVGEGPRNMKIYATAFGGHLFYDLFLQCRGGEEGHGPLPLLGFATGGGQEVVMFFFNFL